MSRTTTAAPRVERSAIRVTNAQREAPVNRRRVAALARRAVARLGIRTQGTLAITFIDRRRMQALNQRFTGHDRATDVLSFRYDDEPVVGEILIAPRLARTYASEHGVRYETELSRYVVHGLLHWLGHEDTTPAQRRKMRVMEDALLSQLKLPITKSQSPNNHQ